MKVRLATSPSVVRKNFAQTRSLLVGGGEPVSPAQPESKPVRSITPGPVLSKAWQSIRSALLMLIIVLAGTVGVGVVAPSLYFQFAPVDVIEVPAQSAGTPIGGEFAQGSQLSQQAAQEAENAALLPPQDESLPTGEWLVIPRIGVRTQLQMTEQAEEALEKGVWLVPDFAKPGDFSMPMILAAHRYGWQWWWQSDYWKYHSFYLLPDLEPGDTVEVIADQRKWVYEIYAGEEGDEITDYQADLILYTCKFLNSPVRHFRYARLVDRDTNTQR